MWGDNDLGDNFSLSEGDRLEDRAIILCSGRSAGACKSGEYIVPSYQRHYDDKGNYAEYVETATSDKHWIIAKTIQIADKKENYWIIQKGVGKKGNKVQPNVLGPFDKPSFNVKTKELNINLELNSD
jgi:hypothetical protein